MRLVISGYRDFYDKNIIEHEMMKILNTSEEHTVIHGGCRGVDMIGDAIAKAHGWNVEVFKPDWSVGKRGALIRNEEMVVIGRPTYALLFIHPESRGTKHMLGIVKKYGIPHTIVEVK